MSYLKVVYNRKREPKTAYPNQLTGYLFKRFKFKMGEKILELGVGNGDFLAGFQNLGLLCFGIDREISMGLDKNLKIKKVDITKKKLPFPNETFDVVYHKSFLEHFYTLDADRIMSESYRVLKKGGKIIILVPDWVSQMENFFEDYTQVHPYDRLAIEDLLKIFNYKNVTSERFHQLPSVWKYPSLKYFSRLLGIFMGISLARWITEMTGWKFIRWSVELMVLGYGEK